MSTTNAPRGAAAGAYLKSDGDIIFEGPEGTAKSTTTGP